MNFLPCIDGVFMVFFSFFAYMTHVHREEIAAMVHQVDGIEDPVGLTQGIFIGFAILMALNIIGLSH